MCFCGFLGACCSGLCAGCCTSLQECRIKHGFASRIPYIFIVFIFSVFAVFMSLYGEKAFYQIHLFHFKLTVCNSSSCEGNGSVYRTSFTLFIFFILHAILIIFIKSFQWIFFGCKLLFLIGFLTATFWIPNSFFDGYAQFARIASAIFLVLQVIILISTAWDINDCIVAKIGKLQEQKCSNSHDVDQEKNTKIKIKFYQFLLVLITLILIAAIIILCVYLFKWFDKHSSCSFNQAIISITIVLVFLTIVIPPFVQSGSIFTASVVGFYMTYLCYTALTSYPKQQCNPFSNDRNTASLWIGIVLVAITVSYLGFNASRHNLLGPNESENNNNNNDDDIELQVPKKKKVEDENDDANDDDNDTRDLKDCNGNDHDEEKSESDERVSKKPQTSYFENEQKSNFFFHLSMAFASVYMCMLYTNWGTDVVATTKANSRGKVSLWVNIGSQWATFILFIWTIMAPKICPKRFGIDNTD